MGDLVNKLKKFRSYLTEEHKKEFDSIIMEILKKFEVMDDRTI
jgi:hypothetical protein